MSGDYRYTPPGGKHPTPLYRVEADDDAGPVDEGDIVVGDGDGSTTTIPVGANDTVLTADSGATGGMSWQLPESRFTTWTPTVSAVDSDLTNVATGTSLYRQFGDYVEFVTVIKGEYEFGSLKAISFRVNLPVAKASNWGTNFDAWINCAMSLPEAAPYTVNACFPITVSGTKLIEVGSNIHTDGNPLFAGDAIFNLHVIYNIS